MVYTGTLTAEQVDAIVAVRDEWMTAALSTERCDRPAAELAVGEAYKAAGFDPPELIIWMDSPLGGAFAVGALRGLAPKRGQLWGQLGDQLRGQLGGQLGVQLGDQLGGQLGDQLGASSGTSSGPSSGASSGPARGPAPGPARGPARGQLRGQLWDQLQAQLGGQLGASSGPASGAGSGASSGASSGAGSGASSGASSGTAWIRGAKRTGCAYTTMPYPLRDLAAATNSIPSPPRCGTSAVGGRCEARRSSPTARHAQPRPAEQAPL